MCGITGFIDRSPVASGGNAGIAIRMRDCLTHRGPDDAGVWTSDDHGVALGHRRLSIIDLSEHGHQPMTSPSARYVIVFNGEIYNYRAIRAELEGSGAAPRWRGHSDTEVMLAAFERWGIVDTLARLNGMFALAIVDTVDRVLHLARDRMGEKPLYYGWSGRTFLFGSQLRALRAHPDFRARVDRAALGDYLRYGYVPGPRSIFEGVRKLPAATVLTLSLSADVGDPGRMREYWSLADAALAGAREPFRGAMSAAADRLDTLLADSVALRMEADVPHGAFLSGGVDSSLIVALMQRQASRPVRTFTVGFREAAFNEADNARAVAEHLGTDHTELVVTSAEAMALVPALPTMFDEPFADASQVPTYLVSRLAREHVTVSLSGDGGDELFGGYNRYVAARSIWRRIGWMPLVARRAAAGALQHFSADAWDRLTTTVARVLPPLRATRRVGEKVQKVAALLGAGSADATYDALTAHWGAEVLRHPGDASHGNGSGPPRGLTDLTERMMFRDMTGYLPDDILVKLDRASMAASLEGRVPFLDHRVVEFAWSVPLSLKIGGGQGKRIVREVLDRYVPRSLIDRPKMGFGVPIDEWLRGPLRAWAEALLDEHRLAREGYLDARVVRDAWEAHLSGRRNWHQRLWSVLMFQAWLEASDVG